MMIKKVSHRYNDLWIGFHNYSSSCGTYYSTIKSDRYHSRSVSHANSRHKVSYPWDSLSKIGTKFWPR